MRGRKQMRQAVMTSPGVIELRDVAEPAPGPGEVLLRIKRIGVCGSDVHVWHGKHPFTTYPVVQGHEFSAVVEAVGEGVKGIVPGAKATATPQLVCGECRPCKRGDYHICDSLKVQGFQAPGCAQELFKTDAEKVVALPESFTFEQGALVEPASVAAHATGRAARYGLSQTAEVGSSPEQLLKGRNVVVVGAGPIGNLMGQAARVRGAGVLVTDMSDYRLEVARQCGLVGVSNARQEALSDAAARVFGEDGFDLAFECAGAEDAFAQLVEAIEKGGTIMSVGLFQQKPRVHMSMVCEHELCLLGTLMYQKTDYEQAVRWIHEGLIRTGPLDSRHFPFERYAEAYRFIEEQGEKSVKVFVDL